jgi:acyl-CoA reductase-like NAD-dependent aldehyde dehydrogenase
LPPEDPKAALAAFTVPGQADAVSADIDKDLQESGVHDLTAKFGNRLVKKERCDYLRPTVILCDGPDKAIAKKEYMFPFCTVVECPQGQMLAKIGSTLVCSAITDDKKFQRDLLDATHIDRLNIGPLPTIKLNWLQPHEGSIVDFLFRARAFQFEGMLQV